MWWMSGVVNVLIYPWCGGCLVWWMSSVVDVVQSSMVMDPFKGKTRDVGGDKSKSKFKEGTRSLRV